MINTVEQDQVAVWSGSAVFITKSSYDVEQDQGAVLITKSLTLIK